MGGKYSFTLQITGATKKKESDYLRKKKCKRCAAKEKKGTFSKMNWNK